MAMEFSLPPTYCLFLGGGEYNSYSIFLPPSFYSCLRGGGVDSYGYSIFTQRLPRIEVINTSIQASRMMLLPCIIQEA